jgi:cytochrome c
MARGAALLNHHPLHPYIREDHYMKSIVISSLVAAGLLASAPAFANKDLATKSGCMACHQVDKKVVGPAYAEVAKKYKAADEAKLVEKVIKGGSGAWGTIPMPPNPKVSPADAQTLVKWILAGAK